VTVIESCAGVLDSTASMRQSTIPQLMAAVPNQFASPLEVLASVTDTSADDWESLDGPDSGVGIDYWYRHRGSGAEAYLNRDQDHLTISVDGQKLYDSEVPSGTDPVKAHKH
jgi:hypothetical protein